MAEWLGEEGIFVWDGHFYAFTIVDRLGLADSGGLVRIGFAHYNTAGEIDRLLEALARLGVDPVSDMSPGGDYYDCEIPGGRFSGPPANCTGSGAGSRAS